VFFFIFTDNLLDINMRLFVFRAGHGWWWVPLVVTCVGALLGSLLYELLIGTWAEAFCSVPGCFKQILFFLLAVTISPDLMRI